MSDKQKLYTQPYELDAEASEKIPWVVLLVFAILLWGGVWWLTRR